jgi:aminopeptidase N
LDTFDVSVPMSTYLVAFVVSNFKFIKQNSTKYGVLVEVAARPNAIDAGHGQFGLDEASKILDYYSDYFETKYPLQKSSKKWLSYS